MNDAVLNVHVRYTLHFRIKNFKNQTDNICTNFIQLYTKHKIQFEFTAAVAQLVRAFTQGRSQGGPGVPQVHVHPPFQKKKYNMNKQNFVLTFLGKFIYLCGRLGAQIPKTGSTVTAPLPNVSRVLGDRHYKRMAVSQ